MLACARSSRPRAPARASSARVVWYALEGDDTGDVTPTWLGALVSNTISSEKAAQNAENLQAFDLFAGGVSCGRLALRVPGAHNVRNAIGAMAACTEGFGVSISDARAALAHFDGVRRRQDLLGTPGGVFVYDDFAHHPTAVDETLRAIAARHPSGKLIAVFEPRSATACRSLHQKDYVTAFGAAARVVLAPLGRSNVPEADRLDLARLASDIGPRAIAAKNADEIVADVTAHAHAGDVVALLSNGAFGGIHAKVLAALESRAPSRLEKAGA
jgi:UDP-N-acetylmuramate: L-alanyl-gamma-D-glutamyl-meso-diaminopimelate ligase